MRKVAICGLAADVLYRSRGGATQEVVETRDGENGQATALDVLIPVKEQSLL